MKQLLEKIPFFKKKKKSPIALQIKKTKKQIKGLKIKLFLLYTLPVFIVALAKAVIEEYGKIHAKNAAMSAKTDFAAEMTEPDKSSQQEDSSQA